MSCLSYALSERNEFILENDKKYKSVDLFNTKKLNEEITNMKLNINDKRKFLSTYHQQNSIKKNFILDLHNKIRRVSEIPCSLPSSGAVTMDNTHNYNDFSNKVSVLQTLLPYKETTRTGSMNQTASYLFNSRRNSGDVKINSRFFNTNNDNLNYKRKSQLQNEKQTLNNSDEKVKKNEVDLIYKKVFGRYKYIKELKVVKGLNTDAKEAIEKKRKLLKLPVKKDYISEKIKEVRAKVGFIKGVYDYAYPLIMIEKLKTQKKLYDIYLEQFYKKNELNKQQKTNQFSLVVKTSEKFHMRK